MSWALAVYREFGLAEDPGVGCFPGSGLLEVSWHGLALPGRLVMIRIQVRDVRAKHARLAAVGVPLIRAPATEPLGQPLGLGRNVDRRPRGIWIVLT